MVLALIIAALVGTAVLSESDMSRNKKIGYVAGTIGLTMLFSAATYLLLSIPQKPAGEQ
jgi:NADH:ubiquinone oxidoreductase subunit 6 (subunit J)